VASDPLVLLDAAHNPDGARALAEALPEAAAGRPVVAVLAILADKDADAMIEALAPALAEAVCTAAPAPRPMLPVAELAQACRRSGLRAHGEDDFAAAVARGRELARERDGALLVAGSHYALGPARAALGLAP